MVLIINRPRRNMRVMEPVEYGGYVIRSTNFRLREGGFSSEVVIEKHEHAGVAMQRCPLAGTFATEELADDAALQGGMQLIDGTTPGLTI